MCREKKTRRSSYELFPRRIGDVLIEQLKRLVSELTSILEKIRDEVNLVGGRSPPYSSLIRNHANHERALAVPWGDARVRYI